MKESLNAGLLILELSVVQLCCCAGRSLLDLIEALLQAAVRMKNMSPLGSWTFVKTEGGDAAWALEKILDYVLNEKDFLCNQLSPIARPVLTLFKFLFATNSVNMASFK